ncbi:MAG: hypothetical protein ABEK03_04210 [Candidatus Bipolaricaulia bacterium]
MTQFLRRRPIVLVASFVLLMSASGWGLISQAQQPSPPAELLSLSQTLSTELELAFQEAALAWSAPTAQERDAHMQRAINVLVGSDADAFDADVGNPGDGHGAIPYTEKLKEELSGTPWDDFVVTADHVIAFTGFALEHAKATLAIEDNADAREEARKVIGFLKSSLGCRGDAPTTGGALSITSALEDASQSNVFSMLRD